MSTSPIQLKKLWTVGPLTVLAAIILKEAFTLQKSAGLVLIVLGAIIIVWATGGTLGTRQNIGHVLFLCAGLAWAGYTVAMRRARLAPRVSSRRSVSSVYSSKRYRKLFLGNGA